MTSDSDTTDPPPAEFNTSHDDSARDVDPGAGGDSSLGLTAAGRGHLLRAREVAPLWAGRVGLVVGMVAAYLAAIRRFQGVIPAVSRIEADLTQILLTSAVLVAIGRRVAPRAWEAMRARLVRSPLARSAGFALCLVVCISPPLLSWLDARWSYSSIAGVIPWSDAWEYHNNGVGLLDAQHLNAFGMRRPMNAGFYATRLQLTGGNFWSTMLLQGLLAGAAGFLALRTVARRLGAEASLVLAAVMYSFIRSTLDLTLSETLGFTIGCLALASLWQGIETNSRWVFLVGLLTLSFAVNIRAGEMFALPALFVWFIVDEIKQRRFGWRYAAAAAAAMVGGFVPTWFLNAQFGVPAGSSNSNFAYTLYGIAHGGKGWQYFRTQFDMRQYNSESELADAVYRAAFEEIWDHPQHLLRGLIKGYEYHFDTGVFGFMPGMLSTIAFSLMVFGWLYFLQRSDRRLGTMFAAAWAGMLLSIPFIIEDGGFRVLAATVPLMAVVPAAGGSMVARSRWVGDADGISLRLAEDGADIAQRQGRNRAVVPITCAVSMVVLTLAPTVVVAIHPQVPWVSVPCPRGEIPVVARVGEAMPHVSILPHGEDPRDFGEVTLAEFRSDPDWSDIEIASTLEQIEAGSVIMLAHNLVDDSAPMIVAPLDLLPHDLELISFCGRPAEDPTAANFKVMFTDYFDEVNL